MQVVTSSGHGSVPEGANLTTPGVVLVELETSPPSGDRVMAFMAKEVFPISGFLLLRFVNAESVGPISNLSFVKEFDGRRAVKEKCPSGECRFFIDLVTGEVEMGGDTFRVEVFPRLALYPWVDRWAPERVNPDSQIGDDKSINELFDNVSRMEKTTRGLCSGCLLNLRENRIERFFLVGETKKILDRSFPIEE